MDIDQNTHLWDRTLRAHVAQFSRGDTQSWRWHTGRHLDELFHTVAGIAQSPNFLEVGAFDATTSLHVAATRPGTTVRAFEANPVKHAEFLKAHDHTAHGVEYLHTAVSNQSGTLILHMEQPDGDVWTAGSSSILPRSGAEGVWRPDSPSVEVQVPTERLDRLCMDLEGRCSIWVDVEGAAGLVLDGAAETIARCDLLKIEVEDRPYWDGQERSTEILQRILDAGMIPLTRDDEYGAQYNIIATSPDVAKDPGTLAALDAYLTAPLPTAPPRVKRVIDRGRRFLSARR